MIEAFLAVAAIFGALMLLALLRVVLGPTVPDRFLALDTMNTLVVMILIVLALGLEQWILIDVALVYALLAFVGSIFMADYMEASGETSGRAPLAARAGTGSRYRDVKLAMKRGGGAP